MGRFFLHAIHESERRRTGGRWPARFGTRLHAWFERSALTHAAPARTAVPTSRAAFPHRTTAEFLATACVAARAWPNLLLRGFRMKRRPSWRRRHAALWRPTAGRGDSPSAIDLRASPIGYRGAPPARPRSCPDMLRRNGWRLFSMPSSRLRRHAIERRGTTAGAATSAPRPPKTALQEWRGARRPALPVRLK